ncbi:MAG: hypothetical protein J6D03_00755 [Clostridia bacterium]|nr:hypothetical protein [Clostridia bacterium]
MTIMNEKKIPYNMTWRSGINDPKSISRHKLGTWGDPGIAMAEAFKNSLNVRKPATSRIVNIPKMSKQEQYERDLANNIAPIPDFN